MANVTSYATSDIDEIDLCPEPISSTDSVIFQNKRSDVTVASEILRGIKLRERKPPSRRKEKLPMIINLPKPHTARKRKTRNLLSKSCVGCRDWTTPSSSNSIKPKSTSTQHIRYAQNRKLRIKAEKETTCPMRIAELAVPSKRHCIDTWRNKSYILPEDMVDRLKQYVMDQRPVVQLPEALYFFQRRKSKLRKKKIHSAKDEISQLKKQMEMPLRCLNTRALCIILAQKIVLKLLIPLKITLNSDLEKLAKIVVIDMVRTTKGKKYVKSEYLEKYRSIHSDVVNKITIWMIGVLEEQVYKQLEEDLRDLEEEEGPVLDFLDDLLDNVLNICLPEPSIEYTEEEPEISTDSDTLGSKHGGSGDELTDKEYFSNQIHNLINDINNQYEPTDNNMNVSNKNSLQTDIDIIINNILKDFIDSKDSLSATKKSSSNDDIDKVTDAEYFQNEIFNIINMISKESEDKLDNNTNEVIITHLDNTEPIKNDLLEIPQDFESSIKRSIDRMPEEAEDIIKQSESNLVKKTSEAIITHLDNSELIMDDTLEKSQGSESAIRTSIHRMSEETENRTIQSEGKLERQTSETPIAQLDNSENIMDDRPENTQSTESAIRSSIDRMSEDTEDRSKKVMFSIFDMVKPTDTVDPSDRTEPDIPKQSSDTNNSSYTKNDILFSEPNNNLLSDADELWPRGTFSDALLKPSASVTKSITSLGKLSEYDEKDILLSPLHSSTGELHENVKESVKTLLSPKENNEADDENLKLDEVITNTVSLIQGEADEQVPSDNLSSTILKPSASVTKNIATQDIVSESNEKDILLSPLYSTAGEKVESEKDVLLSPLYSSAAEIIESQKDILLSPVHSTAREKNESEEDILLSPIHSTASEKIEREKDILQSPLHSTASEKIGREKELLLSPLHSRTDEKIESGKDILSPLHTSVGEKIESEIDLLLSQLHSSVGEINEIVKQSVNTLLKPNENEDGDVTKLKSDEVIKNAIQVQVAATKFTATKISIDENITSRIEKHETSKQKEHITKGIDNNMKLISQWKVSQAKPQIFAHGDPRDSSMPEAACLTRRDLHKWCEDLDKGFENLDIWKDWLQNTCMAATDLLKKKNKHPCFNRKYLILCRKLKDNLDKDASMWRKMNKQTHARFERFRKYYVNNKTARSIFNARCVCKRNF